MKVKKGNKVILRDSLQPFGIYGGVMFVDDMIPFRGQPVTVDELCGDNRFYIKEDHSTLRYSFSEEMIEKIIEGDSE